MEPGKPLPHSNKPDWQETAARAGIGVLKAIGMALLAFFVLIATLIKDACRQNPNKPKY